MKHLVKNGEIILSGVPEYFTRDDGQSFWGGYQNRTDLHYADGWRNEELPDFDPYLQELGQPYYDAQFDIVKYHVVDREVDLDELLASRLQEFERFQKEFRKEIVELFLEEIALGILSDDVKGLIEVLQQRKAQIIAELQGFRSAGNVERLINYSFYTEEAEQFRAALVSLKQ